MIRAVYSGSRIQGVQKAPDPGFGSATLQFSKNYITFYLFFLKLRYLVIIRVLVPDHALHGHTEGDTARTVRSHLLAPAQGRWTAAGVQITLTSVFLGFNTFISIFTRIRFFLNFFHFYNIIHCYGGA